MEIEIINKTRNNNIQACQEIFQKGNKQEINDLKTVEKIISRDNAHPMIVKTYLTLLNKFNKKEFSEKIDEYKYFLTREDLINEFPGTEKGKLSSSEMFYNFYEKITNYSYQKNPNDNVPFFRELMSIIPKFEEDKVKGFIDYNSNKELAILILVLKIKGGIYKNINKIESSKESEKNPLVILQKNFLKESEAIKHVLDKKNGKTNIDPTDEEKKIYEVRKDFIVGDIDITIKQIKENILIMTKVATNQFSTFFNNFKKFFLVIKPNFFNRFGNLDNLKNNDFELLRYFCFFVQHYIFDDFSFYAIKWNDTFDRNAKSIDDIIKQNTIANIQEYTIKNNILTFKQSDILSKIINIIEVKNIDKYCFNHIIKYLTNEYYDLSKKSEVKKDIIEFFEKQYDTINEYSIEHLLKVDSVQEIYINKIWDIFEEHLIKIYLSPVIQEAFEEICKKEGISHYYNFLNEKDLKCLFKRSKLFQFKSKLLGLTDPNFFIINIYYAGLIKPYNENCSKLLNLSFYQVTHQHEMLGHLNIRIQNYLFENLKEISSPIIDQVDDSGVETSEPESGLFVEKILYDKFITNFNIKEILFLLDADNYQDSLHNFKEKFKKCKYGPNKFSNYLNNFLGSLNITINDELLNLGKLTLHEALTTKQASSDEEYPFISYQTSHAEYLHPPLEASESVEKYIDALLKEYFYPKKDIINK